MVLPSMCTSFREDVSEGNVALQAAGIEVDQTNQKIADDPTDGDLEDKDRRLTQHEDDTLTKNVKGPLKTLSKKKVESYNQRLAKRGVVYLSRVPPFMKPAKVKHLMEQHGVVTRVRTKVQVEEGVVVVLVKRL